MNRLSFHWPQVQRHLISWALILSIFTYLDRVVLLGQFRLFGLPYSLPVMLGPALAVYAHYWLLTHELERRRYGRYLASTAVVIGLGAAGLASIATRTAPHLHATVMLGKAYPDSEGTRPPLPWLAEFGQGAANVATVLLLATMVRYTRRGIVSYYQVPKLRALQLETELSLLKAQVNQHFLFNTLNNLYGLSLDAPDQIPEALLQLADLMRYQLDSSRQRTVTPRQRTALAWGLTLGEHSMARRHYPVVNTREIHVLQVGAHGLETAVGGAVGEHVHHRFARE